MRVGSLFSGVGGMDLGLTRAGMQHAFFCEIDEWRRTVLAHHWPGVPVYSDVRFVARHDLGEGEEGDVTRGLGEMGGVGHSADALFDDDQLHAGVEVGSADLLCGGFPCQDVSVAGKRAGLAGERSGLFHEFARIAESLRPRWLLIENVPGLLTSNSGRDFGVVLGTLAELGYGVAWRILDSRFFGVPQRRRRVFIVGALASGDPRAAAERAGQVLAVASSCRRDHPPRRQARPEDARASAPGAVGGSRDTAAPPTNPSGGLRTTDVESGALVVEEHYYVEDHEDGTLRSNGAGGPPRIDKQPLLPVRAYNVVPERGQGADLRASETNVSLALSSLNGQSHDRVTMIASAPVTAKWAKQSGGPSGDETQNLTLSGSSVRRLTPVECERLQAWPDEWTNPHGTAPDNRRYSAAGDGVTASVAEWIGRRMLAIDRKENP